jgi:hypothetical protein
MARMPRDNSGPRVPWPAPRAPWPSFYRSGDTCRWSRTAYDQPRRPQLTDRRFPQHAARLERNVTAWAAATASTQ